MDSYSAIYNAVRDQIRPCHAEGIIRDVACQCFDMGMARPLLIEAIEIIRNEHTRPSVLYRPDVFIDGAYWCALYGKDLQHGVAGFGDSPEKACEDFDRKWWANILGGKP